MVPKKWATQLRLKVKIPLFAIPRFQKRFPELGQGGSVMMATFDHQQYHINIMNILLPNSCCTLQGMITYPFQKSTFEDADFPNFPFGGIYIYLYIYISYIYICVTVPWKGFFPIPSELSFCFLFGESSIRSPENPSVLGVFAGRPSWWDKSMSTCHLMKKSTENWRAGQYLRFFTQKSEKERNHLNQNSPWRFGCQEKIVCPQGSYGFSKKSGTKKTSLQFGAFFVENAA